MIATSGITAWSLRRKHLPLVLSLLQLLIVSCVSIPTEESDAVDTRPSVAYSRQKDSSVPRIRMEGGVKNLRTVAESIAALLPVDDAAAAIYAVDNKASAFAVVGNSAVDRDTGFEFASVTKVMTATMIAALEEDTVFRLDYAVSTYLPEDVTNLEWESITSVDLLTHTAGAPFLPPNLVPAWLWLTGRVDDPFNRYDRSRLERAIKKTRPEPGSPWGYSNFGYAILGYIAEEATGEKFSDLLATYVLAPAGMETAGVDGWRVDSIAPPLSRAGRPTPEFTFDAMAPAGAVTGSVEDAAAFLRFSVSACHDSADVALRAGCAAQQPAGVAAGGLGEMGYGWVRSPRTQGTVIWHNGGTGGYSSFLGFSPETGRGIVILTNVAELREIDEIAREFIALP